MKKDLTTSPIDRQNILNNDLALQEIETRSKIIGIKFENSIYFTKAMVADFFEIDLRTIERYVNEYFEELSENGYELLKGKKLKNFIAAYKATDVPDINVGNISTKTPQLAVFCFKAFLNIAMLLSESEKARKLRQFMLEIVIDFINQKVGVGTKYINQRDKDFITASLQEENYRRKFTDVLKNCVCDNRFKYAKFTDMIYVSIFKENAKEYKSILDLKAKDKVRETFYSEILDIVASYENGLADLIQKRSHELDRVLTIKEVSDIFEQVEGNSFLQPIIHRGRTKMASRDLALREAFHYQLSQYIQPLSKDEYENFLGVAGDELERLMEENQEVLLRLKENE